MKPARRRARFPAMDVPMQVLFGLQKRVFLSVASQVIELAISLFGR
jgi:hypothetical protein